LFLEKTPRGVAFYKNGKQMLCADCKIREEHLLELLCAAASISLDLGVPKENIIRGISSISYNNTRQNIFPAGNFYVFSDCYNASYESFLADFKALCDMKQYNGRSLVLGDIGELGEYSEAIHFELGKQISKYGFRRVYIVGAMRATVISGILNGGGNLPKITTFSESYTPKFIARVILENAAEGEIILFKASRKMRLEKIIDEINERCFN
jgi:UDP-N-acetylmuramoyl-tripeptide--D-alanyl-D-alanine ligase